MALKHKDECYTMFRFEEDGNCVNRRIHVVELQDALGGLHRFEDERLPNSLTIKTKRELKGRHVAEVLLSPESCKKLPYVAPSPPQPFPQLRDLCNMFIGIVTFLLGSWCYAVISSCF